MDSFVSPRDEIWFLCVCHYISNGRYVTVGCMKVHGLLTRNIVMLVELFSFSTLKGRQNIDRCCILRLSVRENEFLFVLSLFRCLVSYSLWLHVQFLMLVHVFLWLVFNPLNPELNPICYLLALLGAHHFLHVSRIRVKSLTYRRLMSYTYGAPILDVSRSHTTTQHSR